MKKIKGILLDIEGTTSSISFVYDVMFPYVREHLVEFLDSNWNDENVVATVETLAFDLSFSSAESWLGEFDEVARRQTVAAAVLKMMDEDVKATGMKQLQGLIWKNGFESGQMTAHLFEDVAPAIENWRANDIDVRIYSSGSIAAQKLFFGHSVAGDLLNYFNGHYDTTTGPKRESESYTKIADDFSFDPEEILFVSDVPAELDAAQSAGMQTVLSVRPGNKPVQESHEFSVISSFAEIEIANV